jgi:demethylmenaquinone methyltransferase/2-methoxy-6-polyprenyl-1,4-benzoquinol methylase
MDQHWRNVAVKMADVKPTDTIIDVACGTGDLTLKFADEMVRLKRGECLAFGQIFGVDFTFAMLPIARDKSRSHVAVNPIPRPWGLKINPVRLSSAIGFVQGDALALPLPSASADILSIAFGILNVANWKNAIDEFARVLRPGGRLIILEFSLPTNPLMRALYNFYFKKIMPITATLISRDKSGAYKYLPQSVNTFISRQAMQDKMKQAGFKNILAKPLTFGICVCYKGVRT